MFEKNDKFHLPHNSVRIDEFNHMLNCIDLNREFYTYKELKFLFLKKQFEDHVFEIFHDTIHYNLINHENSEIVNLYRRCLSDPSDENIMNLALVDYTDKKTFYKVWNEYPRDYTEFFAFLGLLPTYYKGSAGGENKHYVSKRLKDYINGNISFQDIILDFKYRNSSKDDKTFFMYGIEVRPFVVALKALKYYFDHGYEYIKCPIIAAIVIYSKTENIDSLLSIFNDPTKDIKDYKTNFNINDFDAIDKEIGRASTFLKPYLKEMGFVDADRYNYYKGTKEINNDSFTNRCLFCNQTIGSLNLTPVIGKIFYKLYKLSKNNINEIKVNDLFDNNLDNDDILFVMNELKGLNCITSFNDENIFINSYSNQYAINPYTEYFDINDANYVCDSVEFNLYNDQFIVSRDTNSLNREFDLIKQCALGSNGSAYEESLYNFFINHFPSFNTKWYGQNASGMRLSDLYLTAKIFDGNTEKEIAIIIECKAGSAVRGFDERKEIDDIINTLTKENNHNINGVWYWVVNGDSLPNIDTHGGYRNNINSKSFVEKLNEIQFTVNEYQRVPTIVTAFSFDAIKNYLCYLYDKIPSENEFRINKINVPHFWRWSKKFMDLQYVYVHKELRLN